MQDETGSFIHDNGDCASASHVFCSTWPTGAAPSGGRRVSGSSSSSPARASLPPSRPALPQSSATSSLGDFQRQLPALAQFPLHRFTFNLHCSPPSPPLCMHFVIFASLPSTAPPPLALPFCIAPITVPHPSTSADSAGVQSSVI